MPGCQQLHVIADKHQLLILTAPKALARAQCTERRRRAGGAGPPAGEARRRRPPGNQNSSLENAGLAPLCSAEDSFNCYDLASLNLQAYNTDDVQKGQTFSKGARMLPHGVDAHTCVCELRAVVCSLTVEEEYSHAVAVELPDHSSLETRQGEAAYRR